MEGQPRVNGFASRPWLFAKWITHIYGRVVGQPARLLLMLCSCLNLGFTAGFASHLRGVLCFVQNYFVTTLTLAGGLPAQDSPENAH